MTRGVLFWILIAAVLAFGLRGFHLDERPLHTDESVNAFKFKQLWEKSGYTYDPNENHGPTLAYSTLLWNKLTQLPDFARLSETRLRSLPVLFGLGLILLLLLVPDALGRHGTIAAALLTAVSPLLVYYSRDYIHETLFIFFGFLAIAAAWRHSQTGKIGWIILAGAAIGLMQATKETFIFNLVAAGAALLLNELLDLRRGAHAPRVPQSAPPPTAPRTSPTRPTFTTLQLIAAALAWFVVAFLLFSSFFAHLSGPLDAIGTYLIWFRRAAGQSPHIHSWTFYWQRLLWFHIDKGPIWSEALIFALAVLGGVAAFARRELPGANRPFVRFLVFYTVLLALIYTVLPYKTPWCALDFWQPAILLAGVGAAALLAWLPRRGLKIAAGVILAVGAAQLAFQSWQTSVKYSADPRNPWVYAQTSPDVLNLVDTVDAVAQASPAGHGVTISLIAPRDDYWPLPWYLRTYSNVGEFLNVPGYAKYDVDDIQDVGLFLHKVETNGDNLSKFLLQAGLTNHLANLTSNEIEPILVTNINQILTGPLIYNSNRFQGIHLREQTSELLQQNPHGPDLTRLNRRLLEDAYPTELGTNNLPVEPYSPISIISSQLDSDVDTNKAGHMAGLCELRPNVFLELYVQTNLWNAYVQRSRK